MNIVNINSIDLNSSYFHFTVKKNLDSIEQQGLIAQAGDASKMVGDSARVYLSQGGKGILAIKNSFIFEFKKLRICDIPEDYRSYFEIDDFSSTEKVSEEAVYVAMAKRFNDENYLIVNAVEGEDFLQEDMRTSITGSTHDILGKEGHNIPPEKLSLITTDKGNSTLNVIDYIYTRLLENAARIGQEAVESVRECNEDLDSMFEYIKKRETIKTSDLVKQVIPEIEDVELIDKVESEQKNQKEQFLEKENEEKL